MELVNRGNSLKKFKQIPFLPFGFKNLKCKKTAQKSDFIF